jgi:hypothetical protein
MLTGKLGWQMIQQCSGMALASGFREDRPPNFNLDLTRMLILKCQISVALNLGSRPGLRVRGGPRSLPTVSAVPPFPIASGPGIGAPR